MVFSGEGKRSYPSPCTHTQGTLKSYDVLVTYEERQLVISAASPEISTAQVPTIKGASTDPQQTHGNMEGGGNRPGPAGRERLPSNHGPVKLSRVCPAV